MRRRFHKKRRTVKGIGTAERSIRLLPFKAPTQDLESSVDSAGVSGGDSRTNGISAVSLLFDIPGALVGLIPSNVHRTEGSGRSGVSSYLIRISKCGHPHEIASLESKVFGH